MKKQNFTITISEGRSPEEGVAMISDRREVHVETGQRQPKDWQYGKRVEACF